MRFRVDAAIYRAQHHGLAAGLAAVVRVWHFMLNPRQKSAGAQALVDLDRRFRALLAQDLANVRAGYYPRELLFQLPVGDYLRLLPSGLAEMPRVLLRAQRNRYHDLPRSIDLSGYPRYYRRTFHWQSDGWLSERSARFYDAGVELLFLGTGDVMRRMALPPLVDHLRHRARARVLDLACGTGRFLLQARRAFPAALLAGLDLSPFYVAKARRLLREAPEVALQVGNAEASGLPDESFDAVTSTFLFHELPADARRRVLAEAHRLLVPGGRLVICDSAQLGVSDALDQMLTAFPTLYHEPYFKGYLQDDLAALCREAGFQVVSDATHLVSRVVAADRR
jgi:ubiquinone/menaquinone biosynthesis C-methylase UbiE